MPIMRKPLGLSPVHIQTMYMTFGAGKPLTYGETGFQVSAMFGHRLSEAVYRPRFIEACTKGFVTFQSWDDLKKQFLHRKVVYGPRCVQAIKDIAIFEGGDYAFYKYFDPTRDYSKNPDELDRFGKANIRAPLEPEKIRMMQNMQRRGKFFRGGLTYDSRELPCPCGSRKKFKDCHFGKY